MKSMTINEVRYDRPKTTTQRILSAVIGSVLEWYDFVTYAYLATFISYIFFPAGDETAALLMGFATFGVGFLARPVGGWFFGSLGDRYGRKIVLTSTVLLMAVSTSLIGLLPSYTAVGYLASLLLVVARLGQGLSAGGEATTAYTYIAESADPKRRGWFNSLNSAGCATGILLGLVTVMTLTICLTNEQLQSWGWRIPFFLGVIIAPVGIWMRRSMEETTVFLEQSPPNSNYHQQGVKPWRYGARVFWLCCFWNVAYCAFLSYMPTFAQKYLHLTREVAFMSNAAAVILFILATPHIWAYL
ncbi:MFS transporter [Pseudomonas amygdali]|uniref:MFS transporter n=1 Tax=Pseudomonas amygdali TaxID=47877 RepID=UPI001671B97C|nr:MFS transporter [Pseudomonas amygdali]